MILLINITKEQKEALLSSYPGGIKQFVEKMISDTADRIIIERENFNVEEELKAYRDRRALNDYDFRKKKMTQTTKDKISKTLKEKYKGGHYPLLEETKIKIGLIHRGKIISQETREKIGLANKGKKRTKEQRINIGLAHKGLKYKKRAKAGLN